MQQTAVLTPHHLPGHLPRRPVIEVGVHQALIKFLITVLLVLINAYCMISCGVFLVKRAVGAASALCMKRDGDSW